MPVTVVVGAQWGDEGKAKVIDLLAKEHPVVARYQGGHNAGHTVVVGDCEAANHVMSSNGGRSHVNPEHLGEDFQAILRNAWRCNGALFVDHQEVASRVDATFHHHHVAVRRELVNVVFCCDVSDGDASTVATNQCTDQTGTAHRHRVKFEFKTGFECLNGRRRQLWRMEEDTTDAGEVNPHLVASKNIDRVNWHVLITTSAMEF